MLRFRCLAFSIVLLLFVADGLFAQTRAKNYLTWKNGDAITGQIVGADASSLSWQSDLFRGELQIDVGALNNVRLAGDPAWKSTREKYFLRTSTGDRMYGDVTKIDDDFVYFESVRHGSQKLHREFVAQISHMANAGFILLGPTDLDNWDSFKNSKQTWSLTDSGQLNATRKNSNIYLTRELPDAVQIELELRWKKKLDVIFGLGVPSSETKADRLPRIESWDDSLVLTHDEDFEILQEEIDNKLRRLKLFIVWDRKNNRVFVNDETGKQLCDSKLPASAKSIRSGIYIQNKSDYVSIDTLRIGKVAIGFDPSRTGVHQVDGSVAPGRIKSFDGTTWIVEHEMNKQSISDSKFRETIMLPPAAAVRPIKNVLVRFQDGALIAGGLNSIKDGTIYIDSEISDELIACNLEGASAVGFEFEGSIDQVGKQVLFLDKARIQGELVGGSGNAGDVLRWQPVGSRVALPLDRGDTRIQFQKPKKTAGQTEWPDTLYFRNRDMIPCRITSIVGDEINFESFTEYTTVDQEHVKAIDFSPLRTQNVIACDDDGWYLSPTAKRHVELGESKITIEGAGHFGHGSLAAAQSLTFDLGWRQGSYTNLNIKTFVGNLKKQTGGLSITLMLYNNMVYVTEIGNRTAGNNRIQLAKNEAKITLSVKDSNLVVSVNGQAAYTVAITPRSVKGRGIVFECASIAGRTPTHVTISNFETNNDSAGAMPAIVDPEKKELLLTIPRLRKDNPSKHILCARNGDLLRGELSSLNDNRITFQSRLDDFVFDREVVSSIVWLHAEKPLDQVATTDEPVLPASTDPDPNDDPDAQIVQVLLVGGQRITLEARQWADGILNGYSNTMGKCSIPVNEILEIRQGKYANEAQDIAYADWIAKHAIEPQMDDGSAAGETQSPLIGKDANNFATTFLDGTEFKLADYRGKVVVLDFWATWCGPCIKAIPEVVKATASFKPEDVILIGVNQLEKPELVKQFVEARSWEFKVALDPDGSIGEKFDASSIPQTIVIDREGKISFVKTGGDSEIGAKITAAIREILDRKQDF